jgi:imidazolonepropionase-like amidohydrolase
MRRAVILCALVTAAAAQPLTERPLAISGVTVIDPNAGTAVPGVTVLVREGRITSIGTDTVIPRDSTTIDGRGKFLMPGLWDMHVHLGFARASAFPAFVANGVTAVRDLGGDLAEIDRWRTEIATGTRVGPLIVRVGRCWSVRTRCGTNCWSTHRRRDATLSAGCAPRESIKSK